ncbi:MAG: DUF2341 domain-containing protein [Candidatus Bathyarchaeia archaeon]|jgi:predicted GH43/DUF377 family glycosyl hydrolase
MGKKSRTVIVVVFITLALLALSVFIGLNQAPKVKSSSTQPQVVFLGVNSNAPLYYKPVTLTNSQSAATLKDFQQQVTIDSNANFARYASNLDNVNWQDGQGKILNSWLESGFTSASNASIYWINLGPNTVVANGTFTIYECIYATSVNCMNGVSTGAAPTYTSTYGQYDNGANVFSFYQNFAGTNLPPIWSKTDSYAETINNGLTVTAGSVYTTNTPFESAGNIVETYMEDKANVSGTAGFTICNAQNPQDGNSGSNAMVLCCTNRASYTIYGWGASGSSASYDLLNETALFTAKADNYWIAGITITDSTENEVQFTHNYAAVENVTGNFSQNMYIILGSKAGSEAASGATPTLQYKWVRVRQDPPNNVMPPATVASPNQYSAALDHFTISTPSSVGTNTSFAVAVTACDSFGDIVPSYTGSVYFTSSDNQSVLPFTLRSKYTFTSADAGQHTFSGLQLSGVGPQTITVHDHSTGISAVSAGVNVFVPGENWLTGWSYRKSHVINQLMDASTGYDVNFTVSYGSGNDSRNTVYLNRLGEANFGDVRFTASDGATLLNYWMQNYTSGGLAVFWVQLSDNLGLESSVIYIYYGNSGASTTSSIVNTFPFADDFSQGDLYGVIPYADNPVMTPGSGFDSVAVKDSSVIDVDGTYYMAFSAFNGVWTIALANSSNLESWTTIGVILSETEAWESPNGVSAPCLVQDGSTVYMFYGSEIGGHNSSIGVASCPVDALTDPFAWVKMADNPVLIPSQSWEGTCVYDPTVILVGDTYYMYFSAQTGIGLATTSASNFPYDWTQYNGNPVLTNVAGLESPAVFTLPTIPGYYFMVCTHWPRPTIYSYWSNNLISWNMYPHEPYLTYAGGSTWDSEGVGSPSIILAGNNVDMIFDEDSGGIGQLDLASFNAENWKWSDVMTNSDGNVMLAGSISNYQLVASVGPLGIYGQTVISGISPLYEGYMAVANVLFSNENSSYAMIASLATTPTLSNQYENMPENKANYYVWRVADDSRTAVFIGAKTQTPPPTQVFIQYRTDGTMSFGYGTTTVYSQQSYWSNVQYNVGFYSTSANTVVHVGWVYTRQYITGDAITAVWGPQQTYS